MDEFERYRVGLRKQADDAVAEVMNGIRLVRDKHVASAAHHRAEIERLEQEAANLEADKNRFFPQGRP